MLPIVLLYVILISEVSTFETGLDPDPVRVEFIKKDSDKLICQCTVKKGLITGMTMLWEPCQSRLLIANIPMADGRDNLQNIGIYVQSHGVHSSVCTYLNATVKTGHAPKEVTLTCVWPDRPKSRRIVCQCDTYPLGGVRTESDLICEDPKTDQKIEPVPIPSTPEILGINNTSLSVHILEK